MKKAIFITMSLLGISVYSQQSTLIVNNYSIYDFHGSILANPVNACYPSVSISYPATPNQSIVPANSHQGNGLQLEYSNYASAGTNPLYPITTFLVQTAGTSPAQPRVPSHVLLLPTGPVSLNTDWHHTKFEMYFAGTNIKVSSGGVNVPETYFNGNLGDGLNTCFLGASYITTTYGDAEWFTITAGGTKYSYIQIF